MMLIILLSILFAILMKVSDNFNEHGLKWFKGSNIFFGILWGIVGILLVSQDTFLMNVWLAVVLGFVFRAKIDHLNHGIAASLIIVFALFNIQIDQRVFLVFFIGMIVIGSIHDYLSITIKKTYSELFHSILYYTVLPLDYCILFGSWQIFISLFSFVVAYDITRFSMMKLKLTKW